MAEAFLDLRVPIHDLRAPIYIAPPRIRQLSPRARIGASLPIGVAPPQHPHRTRGNRPEKARRRRGVRFLSPCAFWRQCQGTGRIQERP
jgi:hypothetical protein